MHVRQLLSTCPWRPDHASLAFRALGLGGMGPKEHIPVERRLQEAVDWLRRAQDTTPDWGFVGPFGLGDGWSSSYPETTGYVIPTLLRLAGRPWGGDLQERLRRAVETEWLGKDAVRDRRVLDIGSGSGLHSLSFVLLGAEHVHSFDYDPKSVEATETLRAMWDGPSNWTVERGSILDEDYLSSLASFDVVYSWGVLHHTGDMWTAFDNAVHLVRPGGVIWAALYHKGERYKKHLAVKRRYNRASAFGKTMLEMRALGRLMLSRIRHLHSRLVWKETKRRGMSVLHDIRDWFGGLPYEVADEDEVVRFGTDRGLILRRIHVADEGGCSTYVFERERGGRGIDEVISCG